MRNANAENKKPISGKIAGLTVLEVLFYILSLPIIVILAAVFGVKTYQMVPYYSFWPFVGVILAGVLCLVFVIVVMCISLRKKSKRSILMQTVSIIVAAVMLTSFIAVMLDVILPDVLAQLTSSTLFYEDLSNAKLAEEQAEFNTQLEHKFIMLNLLNGNYDPDIYYDDLKNDREVIRAAQGEIANAVYHYASSGDYEGYEEYFFDDDALYEELFDFIYDNYIMTDPDYALNIITGSGWKSEDSILYEGLGSVARLSITHAIAQAIYPTFEKLAEEGMNNERISELFLNNYASLKNDGYLTYDDSMILYATSGRMTVPVVIRLLLDQGYTYTEDQQAYIDENDEVVEPEGTFYLELYEPEEVDAVIKAGAVDWNKDHTKGVLSEEVPGVNYGVGAVIIPNLDENGNIVSGGYIRAPRKWSILDMDGKNMDVAAISDVVVDLTDVIGGLISGGEEGEDSDSMGSLVEALKPLMGAQTLGSLLQNLSPLVNLLAKVSVPELVDSVLQAVTDVIMAATGGAGLYLNLCVNDDGDLEIAISPTNVEVGMHGYQYMTWMESDSLLFAVMSVMSLREWLYIFGALSVLMAFAAGMCREIKERVRKDIEDNKKKEEAEAAEGEAQSADEQADDAEANAEELPAAEETPAEENVSAEGPAGTDPAPDAAV